MAYKIVKKEEVKHQEPIHNKSDKASKSDKPKLLSKAWWIYLFKYMMWGWLWLIVFAFIPCYIKITYIGTEPALPTDPSIKQFLLSGIEQPMPTPLPTIPESTKKELEALKLEIETLKKQKQELASRGNVDREKNVVTPKTNLEMLVLAEAKFVGLDPILAFTLIETESRWKIDAVNINKASGLSIRRTVDYGLAQLNDKGIVTGYIGKELKLSDGRIVKVNNSNWKSDILLNVHIGFREMKSYYDLTKNIYAAYAMYNGGSNTYDSCLKDVKNLSSLGMTRTVDILSDNGFNKCANNIKNNFYPSHQKYITGNK